MSIKKVISQNKTVRWEVCIRPTKSRGKQIRRRFQKKIDAQEFLHSLALDKRKTPCSSIPQNISTLNRTILNEEIDYWLEKKGRGFAKGYFRSLNPGLKRIRNLCGYYPVDKFTPSFLFDLRLLLAEDGLSKATQNRYTDIIPRVLKFSYKQRRIKTNPTLGYEKVKEDNKEMLFWDEEEMQTFLAWTAKKYPFESSRRWIYCVYLMALETGMRAGEIWGFKLSDMPKSGNKAKISRQALSPNEFGPTKGKSSRFVPFSNTLKAELKSLLKCQAAISLNRVLFSTREGTAMLHSNFVSRHFRGDIQGSGVPLIRFHDLRHTALTLMVKRGISLPVIQAIAGHKDIRTTMRYVHVVGGDIDKVGAKTSLMPRFYL